MSIATLKLAAVSAPALLIGRLLVLFMPFRRVAPVLGYVNEETPAQAVSDPLAVKRIGAVLHKLSRHLPWRCLCFEQALAGMMVLRLHGLASTIYFGVQKAADKPMLAHAWLRCGDQIITGSAGHEQFTVLFTVASRQSANRTRSTTEVNT